MLSYGPLRKKTCLRRFANNTGADQLISAFVVPFLERLICKLATGKISFFYLVSVAEKTGLKPVLSEIPKTGFLTARPIMMSTSHEATTSLDQNS